MSKLHDAPEPGAPWSSNVSRRSFIGGMGLAAAAVALAGCSARGSEWEASGTAQPASENTQARSPEEIRASNTINIGVFSDAHPLGYINDFGNYGGYDIYFAGRLAKELGAVANYVACDASDRLSVLESNEADVVVAALPESSVTEVADPTVAYLRTTLCLVSPEGSEVDDLAQAAGKTAIACSGTAAEGLLAGYPEVGQKLVGSYTDATRALEAGEGDVLVCDFLVATSWVSDREGYVLTATGLGGWYQCVAAVRKGNDALLASVNETMTALGKTNFFTTDYKQTLQHVLGDDFDYRDVVIEAGRVLADEE